jgi:hypothetical protein
LHLAGIHVPQQFCGILLAQSEQQDGSTLGTGHA